MSATKREKEREREREREREMVIETLCTDGRKKASVLSEDVTKHLFS